MGSTVFLFAVLACVGLASAGSKCSGHPKMYNGNRCASTTHYADYHKGACGCGPDNNDNQVGWNHNGFVVAANQQLFDEHGGGWCGSTCGRCIKLTTTGGYVDGQGSSPGEGHSKVFMITNLCPNVWPNLSWCSQTGASGNINQYGYGWHFDLENGVGQITGSLHWNNPEVTWEWANCDSGHGEDGRTPSNGMYHGDCFCGHNGKRSVGNETDTA